jgi:hypothetical protein
MALAQADDGAFPPIAQIDISDEGNVYIHFADDEVNGGLPIAADFFEGRRRGR